MCELKKFLKDDTGATAIEYGLIASLVAIVGIVAFTALGTTIFEAFDSVARELCTSSGGTYTNSTSNTAGGCAGI